MIMWDLSLTPSTLIMLQASGKRCSLFNRPISSPASYDDLTEVTPADIDAVMATSPKPHLLDLSRKSKSNLGTIAEVNA